MPLQIRPAEAGDYPAITAIHNAQNEPDHHTTAQRLRVSDERSAARDDSFLRLVAVDDGHLVATSYFRNTWAGPGQPGKYWVGIYGHEDRRQSGVDSLLLEESIERNKGPVREIWTCIRQDFVAAAPYIEREGFEEQFRSWGSHLYLDEFEPGRFTSLIERLRSQGVALLSYPELTDDCHRAEAADVGKRPKQDEDLDDKLRALQRELEEDVLAFEPIIPRHHKDVTGPGVIHEGVVVAVDQTGEPIGMASLMGKAGDKLLECGLTGVVREWRNRGVATALKVRTAQKAKEMGCKDLNAGGGGVDTPMLRVNRRLGFVIEPAWITFAMEL